MTKHILVVDDVAAMAEQYAYDLRRLAGYRTRVATGGREALDVLAEDLIDCVILDLEMPGVDGFDVLRGMRERELDVPVIVYTGTGDFDRCAQAIRLGAYGFIDKAESMQRVVHEVRTALEHGRLVSEVKELRARVDADTSLVGKSPAMERLREEMRRVAPIPSPVLVLGESGSGKELVARDLHALAGGQGAPFVPVNCAALPETLVESELFGHERGAFTGADRMRRGAFEQAEHGTLFLDEIGELPLPAQAKLLRVLESRELTRVGGERSISVDARVVAATHRDLEADVRGEALPPGPPLPPQRARAAGATPPGSLVRHPAPGGPLPDHHLPPLRPAQEVDGRGRAAYPRGLRLAQEQRARAAQHRGTARHRHRGRHRPRGGRAAGDPW